MVYTVTRQMQWPTGDLMVEISEGGIDYTNPDALVARYPGEFGEFENPQDAVRAATEILKQWREDEPDKDIEIGHGCTLGFTMPFEKSTTEELDEWVERRRGGE